MDDDAVEGAIKIVQTKKEWCRETENDKITIQVLEKHGNGPSLADVLCHHDIKDLTVLVFSIAGKTRGGKSFLMNMMIKYLESLPSKSGEDWSTGVVPSGFAWKGGKNSITKGLWVWPKIYKLKTSDNSEVGILLMDNEGLFATDGLDSENIAMSGISTSLSYLQMFNVGKQLTSEYLESIVRYLVKGKETLDHNMQKNLEESYNLMFLVRDWMYEDEHSYGPEGGQEYINSEKENGSEETIQKWNEVCKIFQNIQCWLFPHPGLEAEKPAFAESRELCRLESLFVEEIKRFIEHLFSSSNLKPPNVKLTGESLYNMLMTVDGKVADDSMSFMSLFTDHANWVKVRLLKRDFQSKVSGGSLSLCDIKIEMDDIMERAHLELMKGKSYKQHLEYLHLEMSQEVNGKAQQTLLEKYERYLISTQIFLFFKRISVEVRHKTIWPTIRKELGIFVCGKSDVKYKATAKIVEEAAKIYYRLLCEQIIKQFSADCNKKNLKDLAGFDYRTIKEKFIQRNDFACTAGCPESFILIFMKTMNELKDTIDHIFLKRIAKLTKIDEKWLKKAKHQQFAFFEASTLLGKDSGNCNIIQKDSEGRKLLVKKLGFAMFGLPAKSISTTNSETLNNDISNNKSKSNILVNDLDTKNSHPKENSVLQSIFIKNKTLSDNLGYSADQEKNITVICDCIFSLSVPPILFSYVFVTFKKDGKDVNVPVFLVRTEKDNTVYLDTNCRIYKSWEDFLQSNTLPDVVYCYPVNGKYDKNDDFIVGFAKAPAAKIKSKVVKYLDHTGTVVTVSAGIAGVAALAGAAPVVGTVAVVGGGSTAVYNVIRSIVKIKDKLIHKEKLTKTDVWNVASNAVAAVTMGAGAVAEKIAVMGAGAVAEKFVVGATRVAQGVNGLNAVNRITVQLVSEDTSNVVQILNEIAEQSLKTMFYFNATSSEDAIKIIKQALRLNDKTETITVLESLVEVNSIKYYVEIGGSISVQKYVSQCIKDIITNLLKTINPDIKDIVLKVQEMYDLFKNDPLENEEMESKTCTNLADLAEIYQKENGKLKERVQSLVNEYSNCDPVIHENFLSLLMSNEDHHIVLILRNLVSSIISKIQETNDIFNNVNHKAVVLQGYDAEFHPQDEVYGLIRGLLDQNETTIDLTSDDNIELDKFIRKILKLLFEHAKPSWKAKQWRTFLLQISSSVIEDLNKELTFYKEDIKQKTNLKCNDLNNLFKLTGHQGNYGNCLLDAVLDKFHSDNMRVEKEASDTFLVPAWIGVINGLFWYHSDRSWDSKRDFIHSTYNIVKDNYTEYEYRQNLSCVLPSDNALPSYLVYSYRENNGCEYGFICCNWFVGPE